MKVRKEIEKGKGTLITCMKVKRVRGEEEMTWLAREERESWRREGGLRNGRERERGERVKGKNGKAAREGRKGRRMRENRSRVLLAWS